MQKFLNPRNDVAFKRLFGTEKNKEILIALVNAVLGNQFHQPIVDVSFLKTYQDPEHKARKQSIVDVLCKDQDGCLYIIEMQVASTDGFQERAQYYACKAYISQMNRGDTYENLKKVIFLAFVDFDIFPNKTDYKSEHITLDKKTHEHDLDKLSFTFVDLNKFGKSITKPIEALSLEEKFYYFLYNADDISVSELEKLESSEEILSKAFKELISVYWTDEEIEKYEDYEKGIRDNKAAMKHAMKHAINNAYESGLEEGIKEGMEKGVKEGMEKGIKEGMEKGVKEGIKNLIINMQKNGASIEFIQKTTNLQQKEIDEILQPHR